MTIRPFDALMLPEAGRLLAERQRRVRRIHSRFPDTFDSEAEATQLVTALHARPGRTGAAAFDGGRMIAFLLAERVTDMLWGRALWMRLPGMAVAGEDGEVLRDLYAAVAAPPVLQGCFHHFAVVPVAEAGMVRAFFSLAFGIEQVHGIVDLTEVSTDPPSLPPGVTIRQAGSGDREILESLSGTIWEHQVLAPVWGIHLPETQAERRKSYGDMADDQEALVHIAFVDGEPAGLQGYFPPEKEGLPDMLMRENGLELCVGGTKAEFRGRGIATAMTQTAFHAARVAGCRYILTDWRSTNLLSSRFWPRRGFVPVAYRLARRVDDRILWAGRQRTELL
ncbi:MAG: GNAT family N-acetyltransferase [Capsulimonadales bacterium]|nr:GNAT family N-acetyltransferase [Capsulimonadales bacterium]